MPTPARTTNTSAATGRRAGSPSSSPRGIGTADTMNTTIDSSTSNGNELGGGGGVQRSNSMLRKQQQMQLQQQQRKANKTEAHHAVAAAKDSKTKILLPPKIVEQLKDTFHEHHDRIGSFWGVHQILTEFCNLQVSPVLLARIIYEQELSLPQQEQKEKERKQKLLLAQQQQQQFASFQVSNLNGGGAFNTSSPLNTTLPLINNSNSSGALVNSPSAIPITAASRRQSSGAGLLNVSAASPTNGAIENSRRASHISGGDGAAAIPIKEVDSATGTPTANDLEPPLPFSSPSPSAYSKKAEEPAVALDEDAFVALVQAIAFDDRYDEEFRTDDRSLVNIAVSESVPEIAKQHHSAISAAAAAAAAAASASSSTPGLVGRMGGGVSAAATSSSPNAATTSSPLLSSSGSPDSPSGSTRPTYTSYANAFKAPFLPSDASRHLSAMALDNFLAAFELQPALDDLAPVDYVKAKREASDRAALILAAANSNSAANNNGGFGGRGGGGGRFSLSSPAGVGGNAPSSSSTAGNTTNKDGGGAASNSADGGAASTSSGGNSPSSNTNGPSLGNFGGLLSRIALANATTMNAQPIPDEVIELDDLYEKLNIKPFESAAAIAEAEAAAQAQQQAAAAAAAAERNLSNTPAISTTINRSVYGQARKSTLNHARSPLVKFGATTTAGKGDPNGENNNNRNYAASTAISAAQLNAINRFKPPLDEDALAAIDGDKISDWLYNGVDGSADGLTSFEIKTTNSSSGNDRRGSNVSNGNGNNNSPLSGGSSGGLLMTTARGRGIAALTQNNHNHNMSLQQDDDISGGGGGDASSSTPSKGAALLSVGGGFRGVASLHANSNGGDANDATIENGEASNGAAANLVDVSGAPVEGGSSTTTDANATATVATGADGNNAAEGGQQQKTSDPSLENADGDANGGGEPAPPGTLLLAAAAAAAAKKKAEEEEEEKKKQSAKSTRRARKYTDEEQRPWRTPPASHANKSRGLYDDDEDDNGGNNNNSPNRNGRRREFVEASKPDGRWRSHIHGDPGKHGGGHSPTNPAHGDPFFDYTSTELQELRPFVTPTAQKQIDATLKRRQDETLRDLLLMDTEGADRARGCTFVDETPVKKAKLVAIPFEKKVTSKIGGSGGNEGSVGGGGILKSSPSASSDKKKNASDEISSKNLQTSVLNMNREEETAERAAAVDGENGGGANPHHLSADDLNNTTASGLSASAGSPLNNKKLSQHHQQQAIDPQMLRWVSSSKKPAGGR